MIHPGDAKGGKPLGLKGPKMAECFAVDLQTENARKCKQYWLTSK